jgi:hypothetical protein
MVVIAAVVAGGVLGGVVRGWSILTRLHSAESRVATLEGQVLRMTKSNAAQERWGKKDRATEDAKELLAAAGKNGTQPAPEGMKWW